MAVESETGQGDRRPRATAGAIPLCAMGSLARRIEGHAIADVASRPVMSSTRLPVADGFELDLAAHALLHGERVPRHPVHLVTVRGFGYRLDPGGR